MGLISRVSSRTYRFLVKIYSLKIKKMSVNLSKNQPKCSFTFYTTAVRDLAAKKLMIKVVQKSNEHADSNQQNVLNKLYVDERPVLNAEIVGDPLELFEEIENIVKETAVTNKSATLAPG